MKFFEFHFNPKTKKKDAIFDTFCFVPQTKIEESSGCLYLIGELKNVLSKTENFLADIAEIIKEEHYKLPRRSAQDSFRESLEKANEFLALQIRKENVGWLGNLNFAVISLTPDFLINLSKVGGLKVLLLREGEVFNIGENLTIQSSAVKTFPNLIEGELNEGDKILMVTEEAFEVFKNEGIMQNLASAKKAKEIKKIFKEKKKILRKTFGACLLILPEKKRVIEKVPKKGAPLLNIQKIPFLTPLFKFPAKILPRSFVLREKLKKSLIALLILTILLFLGYLIFK